MLYYLAGLPDEAQNELERTREMAPDERNPVCRMGLIHLARLYTKLGRTADARAVLEEHLALTAPLSDEPTLEQRQTARKCCKPFPERPAYAIPSSTVWATLA